MKTLRIWLVVLITVVACRPGVTPTAVPATPTATIDELAQFRLDLVAADQNDIDQLDHPTQYILQLSYDPATPTLTGMEEAHYFNRQSVPLNEIYFRLFANYPNYGGKIVINRLLADGATVTPAYEAQNTAMKVTLASPLAPGADVTIHLEFTITIPRNSSQHYGDFSASDSVVTLPSVYPLIPAYDTKGWHIELSPPYGDFVYDDMSFYSVTISVPANMTVIASGFGVNTQDNPDGTRTWRFIGAPMRDFDINLTSQLQELSAAVGDTTINSWYDAVDVQAGKEVLTFAADALKDFESRFGMYPYRKLDVVETPTFAGGIEYPDLVVIGRNLYRDPTQLKILEFDVAHEVSHQWWYGMVGDDQVNYPWVDEALAQYSSLIYEEDLHGKANRQTVVKDTFQSLYNVAKSRGHDAAVNQPVAAFDESDYAAIVYGKGPLFYDVIRTKMGDDKFFAFLRSYWQQYRNRIAFPEDILKTAESACNCSLQDEYTKWILSPAP